MPDSLSGCLPARYFEALQTIRLRLASQFRVADARSAEIDFIACNWQSRVLSRLGEGKSGKGNRVNWKVTLSAFGLIFLAEIGDKTQLAAITMVAKTKAPWAVLTGTVLALALVSLIGVLAGEWLTHLVRPELLERAAAVAFIAIGVWMLVSK